MTVAKLGDPFHVTSQAKSISFLNLLSWGNKEERKQNKNQRRITEAGVDSVSGNAAGIA